MKRMVRTVLVWVLICLAGSVEACSGAHVQEIIGDAIYYGRLSFFVCAGAAILGTVFVVRSRRWLPVGVLGMICALHPTWWASATSGDCGSGLEMMSTYFAVVSLGVLAYQLLAPPVRRTDATLP